MDSHRNQWSHLQLSPQQQQPLPSGPLQRWRSLQPRPWGVLVTSLVFLFAAITAPQMATSDMPTTITSGYFRCVGPSTDCTVSSVVTVDIYNMIESAYKVGNTSVSFTAINLSIIGGGLILECPSSSINFAVHVLIENGFSASSTSSVFMTIEGYLAAASTIIIRGGSYSNPSGMMSLLGINGVFQLESGSALIITGMVLSNVRAIWATGSTALFERSNIEISDIAFSTNQTSADVVYFSAHLYAISNSAFYLRSVTCRFDNTVSDFSLFFSSNTVWFLTGTLEVSNNSMSLVTNLLDSPVGLVHVVLLLSIESNSLFNISHNHVTVSGKGIVHVLMPRSRFETIHNSTLLISNNNIQFSSDSFVCISYPEADFLIEGSNFTTANNIINLNSENAFLFYFKKGLTVNMGSIVLFSSNSVSGVSNGFLVLYLSNAGCLIDASTIYIHHNTISAAQSTLLMSSDEMIVSCIASDVALNVSANSLIQVSNNSITIASPPTFLGHLFTSIVYTTIGSPISISGSSFIIIDDNALTIESNSRLSSEHYLLCSGGDTRISTGSSLQLASNKVIAAINVFASTFKLGLMNTNLEMTLTGNSSVDISINNVEVPTLYGTDTDKVNSFVFYARLLTVNSGVITVTTNTVVASCKSAVVMALFAVSLVTLSNGANVTHSGNVLNYTVAEDVFSYVLIVICFSLTLSDTSTFLIHHDTILVGFSDDVPTFAFSNFTPYIYGVGLKFTESALSNTSAVRVEGIQVSAYRPNTPLAVTVIEIGPDSNVLSTSGSSITIRDNAIDLCRYDGRMLSGGTGTSNFTIAKDAYLIVDNNTLSTQCNTSASLVGVFFKTGLYIYRNATMTVSNNIVHSTRGISNYVLLDELHLSGVLDVHSNTAVGSVALSTMGQERTAIVLGDVEGTNAQFRFVDNTMTLTAIGPLREHYTMFDDVSVVSLTLNVSSASSSAPLVVIANNTASLVGNADTRGNTGTIFANLIITGVPAGGEMIHLVNNTMSAADFSPVHGLYLEMPSTPSSAIVLNSNHLAPGRGTPSWSAFVLNTSSVDIVTCGNTIESRVCDSGCGGNNPCIAYNRSRVNDCKTVTCTASLTPTSSVQHTSSSTQTNSKTRQTSTPSTSGTASGCEVRSDVFYLPCNIISRFGTDIELSASKCSNMSATTSEDTLSVSIPFEMWSSTRPTQLLLELSSLFGPSLVPRGSGGSPSSPLTPSDNRNAESFVVRSNRALDGSNTAIVVLEITYVGMPSLSGVIDTIRLPTHEIIRCPINTSGLPHIPSDNKDARGVLGGDDYPLTASINLGIRIQFEAARAVLPMLDPVVTTTVAVSAAGAAVSGMPSALVRGGMVSSLQAMMRCSEFDPTEEVDRINNPPMLGVASMGSASSSEVLQYKRGSVVLGLAVVGFVYVLIFLSVLFQICIVHNTSTVKGAMSTLRLPSSILPVALLVGEMSSGSAVALLMYRPTPLDEFEKLPTAAVAIDVSIAILVLFSAWAVFIYYAYSSTMGCKVVAAPVNATAFHIDDYVPADTSSTPMTVALLPLDDDCISDDGINDNHIKNKTHAPLSRTLSLPVFQRVLSFLLDPTHEPSLPNAHHKPENDDATNTNQSPPPTIAIEELEVWLQRHYFFVAERRWIAYGAAEALLASLVDIVEGIPVTSRSLTACAFPPATMAVILLVLLTLLLWKRPYAVRLQQWSGLAIIGLLCLASTLVTINVFVASLEMEDVVAYLLIATSALISFFTVVDLIAWLLMLFPGMRRLLGLRCSSLRTALSRIREDAHDTTNTPTELTTIYLQHFTSNVDDDEATFHRVAFQTLAYRLHHQRRPSSFTTSPKDSVIA